MKFALPVVMALLASVRTVDAAEIVSLEGTACIQKRSFEYQNAATSFVVELQGASASGVKLIIITVAKRQLDLLDFQARTTAGDWTFSITVPPSEGAGIVSLLSKDVQIAWSASFEVSKFSDNYFGNGLKTLNLTSTNIACSPIAPAPQTGQ